MRDGEEEGGGADDDAAASRTIDRITMACNGRRHYIRRSLHATRVSRFFQLAHGRRAKVSRCPMGPRHHRFLAEAVEVARQDTPPDTAADIALLTQDISSIGKFRRARPIITIEYLMVTAIVPFDAAGRRRQYRPRTLSTSRADGLAVSPARWTATLTHESIDKCPRHAMISAWAHQSAC